MTPEVEVERLRAAIRKHRDQRGDDRCWQDDYELYAALGEPVPEHACKLDDPCTMSQNCVRYIHSRHDPSKPYLSPQRQIDELQRQVVELRRSVGSAAPFACAALRQGTAGGHEPAECDWPLCGCDPKATEVIAALQECGKL